MKRGLPDKYPRTLFSSDTGFAVIYLSSDIHCISLFPLSFTKSSMDVNGMVRHQVFSKQEINQTKPKLVVYYDGQKASFDSCSNGFLFVK